ncbi:MAG: carboxypeptidase-like regulatory domain-containing protein [Parafilimonas sp.]
MKYLIFVIGFLSQTFNIFCQSVQPLSAYAAGYKSIILKDSTRIYKPDTSEKDSLHFKPLEIDVWYPAVSGKGDDTAMNYLEFVKMLQERSNKFQNDTVFTGLTSELLQYININLQISDTSKLLHLKTNSYKNAIPAEKHFPLIIYQCAYNGMSYENIPLFEQLASNGFIVACITSVGRYPGNMTTKAEDLMEQVYDGLFALHKLETDINVDSTKIGVIGYSWGGLASLLMTMNDTNIKAYLSLDGSEMFYYRDSDEENNDFNQLRKATYFHPETIHASYAYLESGHKQDGEAADSIYNILPLLQTEKKYLRFAKATHEDFSVIPSLALYDKKRTIKCSGFYDTVISCTINFFNQYLNGNSNLFTETANKLYQSNSADSNYHLPLSNKKNISLFKGKVIDAQTKQPIAYVNLGIPNKNIGTVSQVDGSFQIAASLTDTIEVSMIGYESEKYLPVSHNNENSVAIIEMKSKTNTLQEVVITAKTLPVRTLGNTTTSHFFSIGLPLKFLGSEIGIVIKTSKRPALLKSFNFNISENHMDSAIFRFNIYSLKNGRPFENVLSNNILLHVGNQAGLYHIDLNKYKIVLKEDALISLEWIDGGKSGTERGVLFLSAALLNSGTWHRTTSLGKWIKAKGLGVGFNVDVQPVMNKKD